MHLTTGSARIARRSAARFLSKKEKLRPGLGVWVGTLSLGALASVAFLLWRVRQGRTCSSQTFPAAAGAGERPPAREPERVPPPEAGIERAAATGGLPPSFAPPAVAVCEPWGVQAARAIALGKTSELRQIADEMARDGWDSEAGLLRNYALLLERSTASRERVLAEVSRMLEAAGRLRARAAPREKAAAADAIGAEPAPTSAPEASGVDAPIQPLPTLSIGKAVSA